MSKKRVLDNIQEVNDELSILRLMCELNPIGVLNSIIEKIDYNDNELTIIENLTFSLHLLGIFKETIFKLGDDNSIEYYKKIVAVLLENLKGLLTYE